MNNNDVDVEYNKCQRITYTSTEPFQNTGQPIMYIFRDERSTY